MTNRRNYYRLLCVQPDAPQAVIKSSYAALMLKLKQHPDLGGDHETAALLNEAYAVLSDPARRTDYDRALQALQSKATLSTGAVERRAREASEVPASTHAPAPAPPAHTGVARHGADLRCSFCDAVHPGLPLRGERCAQCDSPLLAPMPVDVSGGDQRALPRFSHGGEINLVTQQTGRRSHATILDLTPLGMCVQVVEPLPIDQVVKVEGDLLSAVARVVNCRDSSTADPRAAVIGLKFLTLDFAAPRGTFVSRRT